MNRRTLRNRLAFSAPVSSVEGDIPNSSPRFGQTGLHDRGLPEACDTVGVEDRVGGDECQASTSAIAAIRRSNGSLW